jgi:hypothetical protein
LKLRSPWVIRELTDHERAIRLQARVGAQKTDFVRQTKGDIEASERVELSSQSRQAGEIRAQGDEDDPHFEDT